MEHLWKAKSFEHETVFTSDNIEVECTFQGHLFYSKLKPLCIALDLVFRKYAPTRTRVATSSLRRAIWIFFDFVQGFNLRQPKPLQVKALSDISAEVYNCFQDYLKLNEEPISNAAILKSALNNAALLSEVIPDLLLPYVDKATTLKPRAPLNDDADEALEAAFKKHIDSLYGKIQFRLEVEAALPYTFEEVHSLIVPNLSRSNIFQWVQFCRNGKKFPSDKSLKERLAASPDLELKKISEMENWRQEFYETYAERGEEHRFANPKNPFSNVNLIGFTPDPARVHKTLLGVGYPFEFDLDTIGKKYGTVGINSVSYCVDLVQLLMLRWRQPPRSPKTKPLPTWDDFLTMYYPSMEDMACLVQFIMLQTNWNKETVLALDPDNCEHALTGAMDEQYVVMQSEKNRSQGIGKPYYAPKEIIATSTRSDKYSAWSLFSLANALSTPLTPYDFDYINHGKTTADFNKAFLCIRYFGDWVKKGGRHTSVSNDKAFLQGIKQFLKTHEIYENGERLTGAKDLTPKLRPTWVKRRKQAGDTSHGLLAMFLGHNCPTTTDIHYDNSPYAQAERYARLESELEAILGLLYTGKFDGIVGTPIQEPVNLPFKVFHIPGMERPLWACTNQKNPTWHGAKSRVRPGEKCYVVSKCVFCSRAYMFEDSLPYLMERRIHVVEIMDDQPPSASDYSSELEIEIALIDDILDNWEDDRAIKEAARYQRRNTPLLPRDLNFLQVILEEEDRE
ncbi:hypothetical protein PMA3_06625 [Pseudomonas silesiensis]|uniref:Integrase n=1 Tax=Pseudomonas silesiensis TaxID=1853130 RepID=A0A191YQ51_9PSED|nr:hypothetical protein [Pseudomonas silesiensis]ANJ54851.1 hypothetical protein PMA3_06625 [Pseudomonas silesiensis]